MTNEQSREQLVVELVALRLRVQQLEAHGKDPRPSAGQPSPAEKLLRDSADGICGVDPDGRVFFFNPTASRITGWPLDDALGMAVDDLLIPRGPEAVHPVASVLQHGATEHYEHLTFAGKGDSDIDLRFSVAPLLADGAIVGAVASFSPSATTPRRQPVDLSQAQFDALLDVASVEIDDEGVPFRDVAEALLDPLVIAAGAERAVLLMAEQPGGQPGPLLLEAPQGSSPPGPERPPGKRRGSKKATAAETPSLPELGDVGVSSLATLPIRVRDRVVGIVSLVSSRQDHFDPARVRMLTAAVDRISSAIERREWTRESAQLTEHSETMHALVRILGGRGDFDDKADALIQLAARTVGGTRAALLGPDRPGGHLRWLAGGPGNESLDPADVAHSVAGRVQSQKAAAALADVYGDRVVLAIDEAAASAVAVPVTNDGQLIGVLVAASKSARPHPPSELRLVTAIGVGLGTVMANARLDRQVNAALDSEYQRLDVVRSAAEQLSIHSTDNALKNLVDAARESVGARFGGVAVWSAAGIVKTVIGSGWAEGAPPAPGGDSPDLSDVLGLIRFALVQERKRIIKVSRSPFADDDDGEGPPIQSLLGLPFKCSDGGIGGFFLVDKQTGDSFSTEDERLLGLFSAMASVLLNNMQLYTEQERQRLLLEAVHASMAEGLIVLTNDGQVLSCNAAANELLGTREDELSGKSLRAWVLHSADRFASQDVAERFAAEIGKAEPTTLEIATAGSPRRDLAVQLFPIVVGETERLTGILLHDVTEEREYERRRDTFVSVASHELRTPMTTVMGFTELLLTGDTPPERQKLWLGHIYDDAQRVIDIIDELLDVSKIQLGKLSLDLQPFLIRVVLDDAVEKLSGLSNVHTLEVDVPEGMPFVFADESKLSQIATNLISNAIKYSPRGGTVRITAWYDAERDQAVFSVTDQGMGIAKSEQARLFNTFQRVHTKETESIRGTGLGLYIVKSLAESMGGSVWFDSEVGKGSTFSVALPVHGPQDPDATIADEH